jgi:dienelactone hydrolase
MNRFIAVFVVPLLALASASGAIKEQEIEYTVNSTTLKGYLVYDDAKKGKRPGVLVVHEWWGHDQHARNSARKLAEAGFVGFALDMYGEGKQAHHPKEAGAMAGEVTKNLGLMQKRFNAAHEYLSKQPMVDATKIGAIGYCMGGKVVLDMARTGMDLDGVVSFHGALSPAQKAEKGKVKSKILVLNGAADPFVPKEQVQAFEQEMKAAGADYRLINYPNAKHSFTNPAATENGKKFNLPLEYNADVAKKSWDEAMVFLKGALQ